MDSNFKYVLIGLLIIGLVAAYKDYERKQKRKQSAPVAAPEGGFFPCILEGSIDMPPMADVIKAARLDVEEAKAYLTSQGKYRDNLSDEECMALCSMPVKGHPAWDGVNEFGGGGAYGGRYLTGSFHFEIDSVGQQIDGVSYVTIFSAEHFPVTGGIRGDGGIGMGSIGGTGISGRIENGKLVDARIEHGDGKTYIYGVLNGTWRKV